MMYIPIQLFEIAQGLTNGFQRGGSQIWHGAETHFRPFHVTLLTWARMVMAPGTYRSMTRMPGGIMAHMPREVYNSTHDGFQRIWVAHFGFPLNSTVRGGVLMQRETRPRLSLGAKVSFRPCKAASSEKNGCQVDAKRQVPWIC